MTSDSDISSILQSIYAAPMQSEKWQGVLDEVSNLVGGSGGTFHFISYETGAFSYVASSGFDQKRMVEDPAFHDWPDHDPWAPHLHDNPGAGVVVGSDLVPFDQLKKNIVIKEYLPELGANWRDVLGMLLWEDSTIAGALAVYRDVEHDDFSSEDKALLGKIYPHFIQALDITQRFGDLRSVLIAQEAALEQRDEAVFTLSSDGKVVFSNKRARAIVDNGSASLKITARGQLEIELRRVGPEFQTLLGYALQTRKIIDIKNSANQSLSYTASDGVRWLIKIFPVPKHEIEIPGLPNRSYPALVVVLNDENRIASSAAQKMKNSYGLTNSQTMLLESLLKGEKLSRIADETGVTVHTLRFHLKSMFDKVQVHSQQDLIRIALLES